MNASLVTLRNGQCFPGEAINLAIELEFTGWSLLKQDDKLVVIRLEGDGPLTEAQRESIKLHKPDLLRIIEAVNEIATSDTLSGQVGQKRTRKV